MKTFNHKLRLATLLIVDDMEADVELIKILLFKKTDLHCHILEARHGEEAKEIIHKNLNEGKLIDLILLDINMPILDGFQFLEYLNQANKLPLMNVIMCSGSNSYDDKERARKSGALGYIVKPPPSHEFMNLLKNIPSLHFVPSTSSSEQFLVSTLQTT